MTDIASQNYKEDSLSEEIERHRLEKARIEADEQARDDIREVYGEGEDEED